MKSHARRQYKEPLNISSKIRYRFDLDQRAFDLLFAVPKRQILCTIELLGM
jgi:hypothetical protein